jgi:poly-gamma-glutamate synthesis protein (capsule biosynthesis protein)
VNERLTIAAVGDIGFHGRVGLDVAARGPEHPFEFVAPLLARADLRIGNLEIPFAPSGARPARRGISPGFRADPPAAAALRAARFDLVSLANNHVMDYGTAGLNTTTETLDRLGIAHAGAGMSLEEAGRPAILEAGGRRIGLLARASGGEHTAGPSEPGSAPLDEAELLDGIAGLRGGVDAVIVTLHFGMIYTDYPRREDQALARRLVDAGADAVIGHHPHVLQGIERWGRGIIAYSLGEFLFDPSSGHVVAAHMSELRRQTMLLEIEISAAGAEARPVPVSIDHDLRPKPCSGEEGDRILARLRAVSDALPGYAIDFDRHLAGRTARHEMRVALRNLLHGDPRYLLGKLSKLRWRHIRGLLGIRPR